MTTISIRAANAADAGAIARVYVRTWRVAYRGLLPSRALNDMNELRETLYWWTTICEAGADTLSFVAVDPEAGVVGFVTGGPERARGAGRRAEVYTLYVLPGFQRQGIGKRLFAAAGDRFRREDFAGMVVWVLAGNPARGFYESRGGSPCAARAIRVGGRQVQEVAYRWADLIALSPGIDADPAA